MTDLARQTRAAQAQQTQGADRVAALTRTIQGTRNAIGAALAERIGADQFLRAVVTDLRTTKHLAECSDDSILGGMFVAAQLGLELGGVRGLAYLVPYQDRRAKTYEASLIIGYRGYVELFYRAGARSVSWFLVREGDLFRIASDAVHGYGYQWAPPNGVPDDSREWTGAVAQVTTATGGVVWEYMSRAQILKRGTDSPFWRKWQEEMALKTVLRRLAKTAPVSTDLARAADVDETVQHRLEGMADPVGAHLPVTGPPQPERRPEPNTRVDVEPEPTPPDGDDPNAFAEWEAQQQRDADAYLAEQEAGNR